MSLSDIVQVNISTDSATVERAGFGIPLILAADTPEDFTELVRFYSSASAVAADFDSDGPTYKMAAAIFSQNPKLPRVAVGRLTNKPTQRWALTPAAFDEYVYQLKVNGTLVSYPADDATSVAEIITGLKSAIDALNLDLTTTDQTTYLKIEADDPGVFFSLEVISKHLKIAQDHDDPDTDDDLDDILLEDHSWYVILNPFNSKAVVETIATWAEANEKLFLAQTQDSDVVDLSDSSDTGGSQTVAGSLKASTFFRTALIYHPNTEEFADAAWAGKVLSTDPGSETWAFKELAGVETVALNDTQQTNAFAKRVNIYTTTAGENFTMKGTVSGNEYIDVIRGRDWLRSALQADILTALLNNKKVPFTDAGIATIEGVIRSRLRNAVDLGFLASDPTPVVTVPLAADVSAEDKAARTLTGVRFSAVLAGAIQAVEITGTITV